MRGRFKVQGSRFRIQGSGFKVQGLHRIPSLELSTLNSQLFSTLNPEP
jgi:hypothetical protein